MTGLRLIAGTDAYQQIETQGLPPGMFSQVLAASGGPKWIGIAALDKYLFGEFFKHRKTPIHTLGTSSGAWRLCCYGQAKPLEAYARFEELYIGQRYDEKPTPDEISQKVGPIIQGILGETGAVEIINNPLVKSHFIVCKGKHLNQLNKSWALAGGLAMTAATNLVSRRSLAWHFERLVFSAERTGPYSRLKDLPTQYPLLTATNIQQVLLATGTIPMVLSPVNDIPGERSGCYYDGGITDYHIDLPLHEPKGLTIYPHFYPKVTPGWFDKSLPWRRGKVNFSNALILAPSDDFIASLPYGKIPDRSDFSKMDSQQRITYWKQSVAQSAVLAEEFDQIISTGNIMEKLERL